MQQLNSCMTAYKHSFSACCNATDPKLTDDSVVNDVIAKMVVKICGAVYVCSERETPCLREAPPKLPLRRIHVLLVSMVRCSPLFSFQEAKVQTF